MSKVENLRAGVAEMRSVANRLNGWADELEATFLRAEAPEAEIPEAGKPAEAGQEPEELVEAGVGPGADEPAADEEEKKTRAASVAVTVHPDSPPVSAGESAGETSCRRYSLPEVRAILAEKCAEGCGEQVKALIRSFGARTLNGVPPEKYGELLEAVKGLGDGNA